jgi:hypothetical protein
VAIAETARKPRTNLGNLAQTKAALATRTCRRAQEERAKRICRDCPVIAECREHAVRTPETYGIWGATTPRERAGSITANRGEAAGGLRL